MTGLNAQALFPLANEICPYFQPILSLQTQRIVGFEALGRQVRHGEVKSLGSFFHDSTVGDEQHLRVDRVIRDKAIARMADVEGEGELADSIGTPWLFLNVKPSWIYRRLSRVRDLPTLRMAARHGLDPSRLVIEITEEQFIGNLEELTEMIGFYRLAGCRIAIDDIGSGYSHYDRIAALKPHILKIDLNLLRKGRQDSGYDALLKSYSILAAQMGSSLLVEGVETVEDLTYAIKVGAKYVQGYLFSPAKADLQPAHSYEALLRMCIARHTQHELNVQRRLLREVDKLAAVIPRDTVVLTTQEADALLTRLAPLVGESVTRMYVCREEGFQISSNATRSGEDCWQLDPQYVGRNWIWRPYFIPTVVQMKHQRQGVLSQEYIDLETSRTMRTYSHPISETCFLFVDLCV
ncbi:EAL domain-containing protein [Paenibacillus sp. YYML68]|uniref:EAL domain-containing protein n=1 Tax=Paenibacillus sp. YYML68 TaxID=2909250 RepID=UPI00249263B8|nr:EAL domain-containing protein [Paenibacillus sp. YYML68]